MKSFLTLKIITCFIFFTCLNFHTQAQWSQKGADIDGGVAGDRSGEAISFSADGNTLAIGAMRNDAGGDNSGTVRVYTWNGSSWVQKGANIDGEAAGDGSGGSVSLSSDGNTIAIGANANSASGQYAGHVRVYSWNGSSWVQKGADMDGEATYDNSGLAISLSSDGNILAVGATGNDGNGIGAGHVRVYVWNGSSWVQKGTDIDGEAAGDMSGKSVFLSSDGNVVAIGAYRNDGAGDNAGHVRVFSWDGSSWSQRGSDIDGEAAGDESGTSVSLSNDGNTLAIGAPKNEVGNNTTGHVRVYNWNGSSWNQRGVDIDGEANNDNAGGSVSLSSDGNTVAIGAWSNSGNGTASGHVRVYSWNGSSWYQRGLDIDGEAALDNSGKSISLSSDGNSIAIGAHLNDDGGDIAGHVRVYKAIPDIDIKQGSTDIAVATEYDFGDVYVSASSSDITFTIENSGIADLNLVGTIGSFIILEGGNADQFSIAQTNVTATISANSSNSFTIKFSPTSEGVKTAAIKITSNDPDEGIYTINLKATGVKQNQNITFEALANKTYGDANFNLNATGGASGNAVTYSSSDATVATVTGKTVTIVGAGTTEITASQAGNVNYNAASDVVQTLTVEKADQIITFEALASKTYGDANFDLNAIGGASGSPVTYSSSDASVATVSGNTVTIVGAGTTEITASQAGNDDYNAVDAVQTLTVTKADQSVTFEALASKIYGDANFDLNATGGASGNPVTYSSSDASVATVSGNTVTIVGAGTTEITASQTGNDDYNAADAVQTLTVTKADQSVIFESLASKIYGDVNFDLTATGGASGNAVTYSSSDASVATVSGNTVTIVGAGTTEITASQAGNDDYNAADAVQTLTVAKANQSVIFESLASKIYGDANFDLTATGGASGNAVTYSSSDASVATVIGNTVTIVGAGTTEITASQAGNDDYNAADAVQTLTVAKANQSVTFEALASKTSGDANYDLTATASSGLAVTYTSSDASVATVSGNTVTIVGVGTTEITASQVGDDNYNAASDVVQTLTVEKGDQSISFESLASKTYGDANFDLNATGGASGNAVTYSSSDASVATVVGNTVTIVGAGTTEITASQAGNDDYNAANAVQTLTVVKANQSVIFEALASKIYGDANFDLTAIGGASGSPVTYSSSDASVATVSGNTVTIVGAGTTEITASQAGNNNYNAADAVQTLTVEKGDQSVTFEALASKTSGEANYDLTATASSGLAVTYTSSDASVATVSGNTVTIVGVGTTEITASQVGDNNYNAASDVVQTLTVEKGDQSISFNAIAIKKYGDTNFDLSATASSGLAVTYTSSDESIATVSGNTVTIVGVGRTEITASQVGNDNYNAASDVVQTLTVEKGDQSISFESLASKTYGDANFDLNATGGASGNAVTYSSSDASVATVVGNTVTIVGAGTTEITASQAGNDDYNAASVVIQTLTVEKGDQIITFEALASKIYGDANFDLTAIGGASGSPVTYSSSDASVATVSGNTVTIVGAGSTEITASQAGNDNYNAASVVIQTLTVEKGDQSISFEALASKTYGDANFDLNATGGASGSPVTYSSSDASVATVVGNTVTIIGAGTTEITASQAGNDDYSAAAAVQTLTVTKADQSITFEAIANQFFEVETLTLSATASSGLGVEYTVTSGPATVEANLITLTGLGLVTIEARQAGNINYFAAEEVSQSFEVVAVTAISQAEFSSLRLYPNPSSDILKLKNIDRAVQKIIVFNAKGQRIHQIENPKQEEQLMVKNWKTGIYMVVVRTANGQQETKFIKK
ncbi:choice-of-anchor D domain-containing protein [Marivirga harenae]|uniref:choice-of-anchor D domain-containing protein n=1 Tax=Marivirga harenae TaxID=2010992 RepID=UPI0026E06756|nr:choice-of-anchor D domain-containing protein [Marivirga harenae]WKV12637.1 choice-of-anchor D domain-containing protein [Marivirga harenae]